MFVEGTGSYWAPGYSKGTPTAPSYIPETVWNETPKGKLATSGGGASMFFAKPSWQTGPGVPNVNARLVPDVSFAADWDHDPYIVLANDDTWDWGGTSAATPVFAEALTILNQYLVSSGAQSRPGLGNINPRLYQMAQTTSGVFHDITTGNNIVPCKIGTPDCMNGRYGYTATPGWDPVTVLGSLDVNNFILKWSGSSSAPSVTSTTVTVNANPSVIAATASTVRSAVVKPASGTILPTRPVYFGVGQTSLGYADLAISGGTASASITVKGSQLAAGASTITAFYGGASTFLSSTGTTTVTVSGPAGTASSVSASTRPSPVYKQATDADGFAWFYTLELTETAGVATKVTGFSIDGSDYSEQLASLFGDTTLPARGMLTASMRARLATVPSDHTFAFSGIDPSAPDPARRVISSASVRLKRSLAKSCIPGSEPDRTAVLSDGAMRASSAWNTGSASTARALPAGLRPAVSCRRTASTDADGAVTISWLTIKGMSIPGSGKAPNGRYCSTPSPTISSRLFPRCATAGLSSILLALRAAAKYA
jgi:hypothetical protein